MYGVSKIITQEYNSTTKQNDIALIKIKGPIEFNMRVRPICLPKHNDPRLKVRELLKVAGWGYEEFKSKKLADILKEVQLSVITYRECSEIYNELGITITRAQICTHTDGKDTCQGDSGGPAIKVINGLATIVGLISFGRTCADNYPRIFTKVSYYIKWIEYVIKSNSDSDL